MPRTTTDVPTFLAGLEPPLRDALAGLRAAILASDPGVTENIKWNAPSFCYGGDDRVTFRLPPRGGLQLIFHRGAKVRDAAGFAFDDPSGLIAWAAADRGVVTLNDFAEIAARTPALAALARAWMRATA